MNVPRIARRLAPAVIGLAALASLPAAALEQSLVRLTATPRYAAPGQPIQLGATVYFENLIFVSGPWLNPFPGTATFYANGVPIAGCTAIAFPNDLTPWDVPCSYTPPSAGHVEFHAEYSGGGNFTPGTSPYVPSTVAEAASVDSPLPFTVDYTASTFGALVTSRALALSGFTGTRPITVSGGQYAIGCAPPWRTDAGTVAPGDVLCVRHVTPSIGGRATTTRVTIGTVESSFQSVTDYPDSGYGQEATIAAGISHTLAYSNNAGILAWGDNTGGKLGLGNTANTSVPANNRFVNGPLVAAGLEHSLVGSNGFVTAMGLDTEGQLGTPTPYQCTVTGEPGTFACRIYPESVAGPRDPVALGAGWRHSLALTQDGSVWAWGSGYYGQNGKPSNQPTPALVQGLPGAAVRIAAGYMHSVALLEDGRVAAWGSNQFGELGPGVAVGPDKHPTPVIVQGLTDVVDIAAGGSFTLALRADGTVWSWGANIYGQLGDPAVGTTAGATSAFRAQPAPIPGLSGIRQVAAGFGFAFARTVGGTVYGWGYNQDGQVNGIVPTDPSNCGFRIANVIEPRCLRSPSPVLFSNIVAMYPGGAHTILLRGDGTLRMIGNNAAGQLAQPVPAGTQPGQAVKFVREMYDPNTFLNPAGVGGTPATVGRASGSGGLDLDDAGDGIDFGPVPQGQASAPITLRLSNLSDSTALSVGTIDTISDLPGEFSVASRCPATLGAGASCELDVTFTPGEQSDREGRLDIQVSATDTGTITMALRGNGIDPRPIPAVALNAPGGTTVLEGTTLVLEATVSGPAPAEGTVTFSLLQGGPIPQCTGVSLGAGTGKASCSVSTLPPGGHSVIAYYSGSVGLQPAGSGILSIFVSPLQRVSLTVAKGGSGTGAVTSAPAGITCGATCAASYLKDTMVTLTAMPDAGSTFAGWSGAGCSGTGTCQVTLNFSATVTATFVVAPITLTVTRSGAGTGAVASSPEGIACGATCSASFNSGTVVTLSATPAAGSTFTGWSGGGCSGTGTCQVTLNAATTVTAAFIPDIRTLSVTKPGVGSGTVASTPAGIDCGAACSAPFPPGSSVRLVATPASGSYFTGWSGACTGTGPCTVTMEAARAVTAGFSTDPALVPRLLNIATRMPVLTGDNILIGGFVIGGTQPKTVVVRASGPSLAPFGITNFLANPALRLFAGPAEIAANDDWRSAANAAAVQASGFAPSEDAEAAILVTLAPGGYTAQVSGANGETGVGIIEVFEVDLPQAPLINIATRGQVLTGNNVMIGGFVITGSASQTVVVRVRAPSLAEAGLPAGSLLADPILEVFTGATRLATSDDWRLAADGTDSPDRARLEDSGFAPANDKESAVILTLPPGGYTAIVRGKNGGTGIAIIEVFAR